jgi:hypothetical protein
VIEFKGECHRRIPKCAPITLAETCRTAKFRRLSEASARVRVNPTRQQAIEELQRMVLNALGEQTAAA